MAVKVKTTGGSNLKRVLRESKRNVARGWPVIEVGFLDARIGVLAVGLEYGNPNTNLPERPAFRQGVADLERQLPAIVLKVLKTSNPARDGIGGMTQAQAAAIGLAARDVLRQSYEGFEGPGLSERQARRKAGTAGAGQELIGHAGPKLIGHLEVAVDGRAGLSCHGILTGNGGARAITGWGLFCAMGGFGLWVTRGG